MFGVQGHFIGAGSLLCGTRGLKSHGWQQVPFPASSAEGLTISTDPHFVFSSLLSSLQPREQLGLQACATAFPNFKTLLFKDWP